MLGTRMAGHGLVEKVLLLLQRGAEVDARDKKSQTPLTFVMARLKRPRLSTTTQIMRILLDHGADLDAEDNKGLTALSWAAWKRDNEAVMLLLERGGHLCRRSSGTSRSRN